MAEEIRCASCGVRFVPQTEHQGKMVVCPNCHRPTRNEPAGPPPQEPNPFAAPEAAVSPSAADRSAISPVDSPEIYRALAGTRPWVLILGLLGLIVCVVEVAILVGDAMLPRALIGANGRGFVVLAALPTFLLASTFWLLFRYGRRISSFLTTRELRDLERALLAQRAFWRMAGLTVAVCVLLLIPLLLFFVG
jgi:hypothetical protein